MGRCSERGGEGQGEEGSWTLAKWSEGRIAGGQAHSHTPLAGPGTSAWRSSSWTSKGSCAG